MAEDPEAQKLPYRQKETSEAIDRTSANLSVLERIYFRMERAGARGDLIPPIAPPCSS